MNLRFSVPWETLAIWLCSFCSPGQGQPNGSATAVSKGAGKDEPFPVGAPWYGPLLKDKESPTKPPVSGTFPSPSLQQDWPVASCLVWSKGTL